MQRSRIPLILFSALALGCGSRHASEATEAAETEPRHERPAAHDEPEPDPASSATSSTTSSTSTTAALPIDGARAMATLTEPEMAGVCTWLVENAPHRRVECEDGPTFEVGVGRDDGCPPAAMFAGCTLTVAQATSCMADNARDPCAHGMFGAASCVAFRECMMLQMGAVREDPGATPATPPP